MYCVIPGKGWAEAAAEALAAEAEGTGGAKLSRAMIAELESIAGDIYRAGIDRTQLETKHYPSREGTGPSWQRVDRKPYLEVWYPSGPERTYRERARIYLGTASTDAGLCLSRRISAERHLCAAVAALIGEQEARPVAEYQAELSRLEADLEDITEAMQVLRRTAEDMQAVAGGRYSAYAPAGQIERLGKAARRTIEQRARLVEYLRYRGGRQDEEAPEVARSIVPGSYVTWDPPAYIRSMGRHTDLGEVLLVNSGTRTAWLGGAYGTGAFGPVPLESLRPAEADCSVCLEAVPGTVRRRGYVTFCPLHADGGPAQRKAAPAAAEA